jgi:hypothetical protein
LSPNVHTVVQEGRKDSLTSFPCFRFFSLDFDFICSGAVPTLSRCQEWGNKTVSSSSSTPSPTERKELKRILEKYKTGHLLNSLFTSLKGQSHEIFDFWFFHESVSPKPHYATGIGDTSGKFATGINNTNCTGGKICPRCC